MTSVSDSVAAIRAFNRFYTRFVGALGEGHLGTPYTLTEIRVLFELHHGDELTSSDLCRLLNLDAGYLSRILKRFEAQGFVERRPSEQDGRSSILSLTPTGREEFVQLDQRAANAIACTLERLPSNHIQRLTSAMGVIRNILQPDRNDAQIGQVILREPRSGDFGWAIARHGELYADEQGWGLQFEGLVAEYFGKFARRHDPVRERCWIAELNGERAGCVFVVAREPEVAQLRCLLVEPSARGHGIGGLLVDECMNFARHAGYKRMILWTDAALISAHRIYEAAGFKVISEESHYEFGLHRSGQTWEAVL